MYPCIRPTMVQLDISELRGDIVFFVADQIDKIIGIEGKFISGRKLREKWEELKLTIRSSTTSYPLPEGYLWVRLPNNRGTIMVKPYPQVSTGMKIVKTKRI